MRAEVLKVRWAQTNQKTMAYDRDRRGSLCPTFVLNEKSRVTMAANHVTSNLVALGNVSHLLDSTPSFGGA